MSDNDDDIAQPRERLRPRRDDAEARAELADAAPTRFFEKPTWEVAADGDDIGDVAPQGIFYEDSVRTVHDGADSDGFFEKPTWEVAADDEPGLLDDGGL